MPASAIASLPFMPIFKLITWVVLVVLTVVVVEVVVVCGGVSAQPKSVRVRSASAALRRSVVMVGLASAWLIS